MIAEIFLAQSVSELNLKDWRFGKHLADDFVFILNTNLLGDINLIFHRLTSSGVVLVVIRPLGFINKS